MKEEETQKVVVKEDGMVHKDSFLQNAKTMPVEIYDLLEEKKDKDFEILKVIDYREAVEIEKNPILLGDHLDEFWFELICPYTEEIKCNGLYIARNGHHLEIGYCRTEIVR